MQSIDRRASGLPKPRKKKTEEPAQMEDDVRVKPSSTGDSVTKQKSMAVENVDDHAFDTPLPVGMQGSVRVFGFVWCSWEVVFGRETILDDHGNVTSSWSGPMFSLFPVGKQFR